jgi:hypothetical protein
VNREQLEHILRAASAIARELDVLVIGSQSVLGSFAEGELPQEATSSMEADIAFFDDRPTPKLTRSMEQSGSFRCSTKPSGTTLKV